MFVSLIPEFYLFVAISFILIWGVFSVNSFKKLNIPDIFTWCTVYVLLITLLITLSEVDIIEVGFNGSIINDNFGNLIKIIILSSSIFCLLISKDFLVNQKINAYEYFIIILFSILGMLLLVSSYDLLTLYLALEMQSLSFYILATFKRNDSYSTEAGLKYFILGSIASGLILFGSSLIYGFSGSIHFENFQRMFLGVSAFQNEILYGVPLALLFINTAIFFKLGLAPFHAWLPDVYEGSLKSVTAIFSVVPYISMLAVFIRLNYVCFLSIAPVFQALIAICATLSIIIAAFGALVQRKIKRFFAFSAIGHMGYIFLGLSAGTMEGLQASIVYIIIYMITSLGTWSMIIGANKKYLMEFHSLSKINPLFAISFAIIMFSTAGIPPLAGFFAKLFVFAAAIGDKLYFFATISILVSCIGAFYYIRIVKILFFENSLEWTVFNDFGRIRSLSLGFSILFIILLMLEPQILQNTVQKMILSLYL